MVKARWPWRPPPVWDEMEAALLLSWVWASRMVFHIGSSVPIAKGDRIGTGKCSVGESLWLSWDCWNRCDGAGRENHELDKIMGYDIVEWRVVSAMRRMEGCERSERSEGCFWK
eukprot:scaffold118712_cov51-Attheya_sp.AAC.6